MSFLSNNNNKTGFGTLEVRGTSELVARADDLGRPLTSVKKERFQEKEQGWYSNRYLSIREKPSLASLVKRWEDKSTVCKNKSNEDLGIGHD